MREQIAALALAGTCTLAIGCTTTVNGTPFAADRSGAPGPTPVGVAALDKLLLDVGEVNSALAATTMKVWFSATAMWDWSSNVTDKNCLAIDGPAQQKVYAGTGWTAIRGQELNDVVLSSKKDIHSAIQAVISFPSAHDAAAFFNASSQSWSACSKRRYPVVSPAEPDTLWTVAEISTDNGALSTRQVQEGAGGWACQRALTVSNNVSIDVVTCSYNQTDPAAVNIASQIAAKVPKR